MAETELSVVCKSCGSEVSPYVTECPYCGTRLRKRAPKLERRGDGLEAQESRRDRRRRKAAERRERKERLRRLSLTVERPYVTMALILVPAALLVVARGADIPLRDLGLVVGTPVTANPWWHYLVSPFLYNDIGYLFAIGVAMVLFVPGLERRLGAIPTAILLVAAGALGALAAPGLDDAFGDGLTLAAGGNGIALAARGRLVHGPARRRAGGPHRGARHDPDRRGGDRVAAAAARERLRERVVGHHRRPRRARGRVLGHPRSPLVVPLNA